jgi:hypothetical protein
LTKIPHQNLPSQKIKYLNDFYTDQQTNNANGNSEEVSFEELKGDVISDLEQLLLYTMAKIQKVWSRGFTREIL